MTYITICYIDGEPVVYEGIVSEEDRRKAGALYPPGTEIHWEVEEILPPAEVTALEVSSGMIMVAMVISMFSSMIKMMMV